jgi:hypothetical protein
VWAFVPLSSIASELGASIDFEVRSSSGGAKGTLDARAVGGGFHPVVGLERVTLTGAAGESIAIKATSVDDGRAIVADSIVLHRIVDTSATSWKTIAPSVPKSPQLGLALAAKGGGVVEKRDETTTSETPRIDRSAIFGAAIAMGALAIVRRRRR